MYLTQNIDLKKMNLKSRTGSHTPEPPAFAKTWDIPSHFKFFSRTKVLENMDKRRIVPEVAGSWIQYPLC